MPGSATWWISSRTRAAATRASTPSARAARCPSSSRSLNRGCLVAKPDVRKQAKYVPLTKAQFRERFYARYYDPAFDKVRPELEKVLEVAWDGYIEYRKSPRAQSAGPGFVNPQQKLAVEWLETRTAVRAAEKRQKDPKSRSRILIVSGSTRSEHTCPGEISKTLRLAQHARKTIAALRGFEVDFLEISDL